MQSSYKPKKKFKLSFKLSKLKEFFEKEGAHQPDYTLVALIFVIVAFGLIMLWSASVVSGFQKFGDSYYYLKHQFFYGVIFGTAAFLVASKIHFSVWKKYAFPLVIATAFLLFLVLIPGVGTELLGARRWIVLGGLFFQPSELAKLTFLIYIAFWLERRSEKGLKDITYGLMPFLFLLGIVGLLILLQPDMGTLTVIAVISIVVYFIAGAPWKHLGIIGVGGAAIFALLVKIAPYRAARLTTFLNPELDPQGIGYHINQALLALGAGGIFGLGLGHSRQKFNFLPEPYGDSIFAIIGEELGFIIAVGVIALFLIVMWRGIKIAKAAPDTFSRLLAVGVVTWISFQAFVNIGSMISLLPMTGIPLPLISYGSTSLLTVLFSLGILINISKYTKYNINQKSSLSNKRLVKKYGKK